MDTRMAQPQTFGRFGSNTARQHDTALVIQAPADSPFHGNDSDRFNNRSPLRDEVGERQRMHHDYKLKHSMGHNGTTSTWWPKPEQQ